MSTTIETRHIKWHKTCKCKCRVDSTVSNNKQRWNEDKCRCKCKELTDKGACDVGEYLDYESCKCRKRLVDRQISWRMYWKHLWSEHG